MADPSPFYGILVKPLVTEKTTVLQDMRNQYAFQVRPNATKNEIRKAVETLFEVEVEGVNTIRVPGKIKRMMGRPSRTRPWKKALVTLAEGDTIEIA